jgi:hypothetical protein
MVEFSSKNIPIKALADGSLRQNLGLSLILINITGDALLQAAP